jgi:hypothetical protein
MSKRRQGFPSEKHVKRGERAVKGGEREFVEMLGNTTSARAAPAGAFKRCCRNSGAFDGAERAYYVRER